MHVCVCVLWDEAVCKPKSSQLSSPLPSLTLLLTPGRHQRPRFTSEATEGPLLVEAAYHLSCTHVVPNTQSPVCSTSHCLCVAMYAFSLTTINHTAVCAGICSYLCLWVCPACVHVCVCDRRCFFGSCVTFNVELLFHYAIEKQFSVGFSYSLCFYNLGHSFLSNVWWWQGAPDSKLMAFTLNSKFFFCLFSNGRGHLSCSSNTNPVPVSSSAWNNPAYTQRLLLSSLRNVTLM